MKALYLWSSGRAIRLGLASGAMEGRTLKEIAEPHAEAVVLVGHRSSILRSVPIPNLGEEEARALLRVKLKSLMPVGFDDFVFGFRLVKGTTSEGKIAIVGAMKTESLRRLYREAEEAGVSVFKVVPAAFANWLAATDGGFQSGVLLSREGADLCFDCIRNGELFYSRFSAFDPSFDLQQEVDQTAQRAEMSSPAVATVGNVAVAEGVRSLGTLPDAAAIERRLFGLDLPEKLLAKARRRTWAAIQRAGVAAAIALVLWAYALFAQRADAEKTASAEKQSRLLVSQASARLKASESRLTRLKQSERLINIAFDPAQTFSDMVSVVSRDSDPESWLTGLTLQKGRPMSLRGQATNGKTVSKLVSRLSTEKRFRNVKLLFVDKAKLDQRPIVTFAISGMPVGNLPFDEITSPEDAK